MRFSSTAFVVAFIFLSGANAFINSITAPASIAAGQPFWVSYNTEAHNMYVREENILFEASLEHSRWRHAFRTFSFPYIPQRAMADCPVTSRAVQNVAIVAGIAPGSGYQESLGTVVESEYLNFSKFTPAGFTMYIDPNMPDGPAVISVAVFELIGALASPYTSLHQVSVNPQNGLSPPCIEHSLITKVQSTSSLAALALADSYAWAWLDSAVAGDKSWKGVVGLTGVPQSGDEQHSDTALVQAQGANAPDPILSWAPQLIALNHPFNMQEGRCQQIVDKLHCIQPFLFLDPQTINFCINATFLHHATVALKRDSPVAPELREYAGQILLSGPSNFNQAVNPSLSLICSLVVDAPLVLGETPLPSPSRIPFWDLLGEPMPFSNFSGIGHLPVMTSRSFLESGEWVGYYDYSMNLRRARWDPHMKGIRFAAAPEFGRWAFKASGSDGVGDFTLEGTVVMNGEIEMKKIYINYPGQLSWDWKASMTPFGIVGTWGQRLQQHGYFWLWKRGWSQE
ncbi:hypothetical protein D0Z07_8118 [Hyphodiscus hymeniophilus]|uniref:Uncharacterized protein n=1 Tax=Hyphodiscus hymeniophilus TaxID=353542 RepID=A0A9P6VEG7_9HELO|nr:hypothetical protein D0Z07_8118 [Hyphodiscus hymeniophilus]